MSFKAKQSTAATYMVGPVLDADGVAVTDGVVGDLKLSKNGGAPAALNGSATLTHRHTGFYSLALTASDLDTVGTAQITIDDTTNTCPMLNIQVVEEVIYDALFAASANAFAGAAGSTTLGAGAITATVIATGAIDADAIADNAIDAGAIASDAITAAKIANGAIDAATFAADVDAEILSYVVDDATRIDASALNTLSGHDPGETIMGATDLGTGSGLTSLAPSATALSTVQWTNARAGYLDNINNATLAGASFPSDPADQSLIIAATDALATLISDVPTNAEFEARTLIAASYFDPAADTVANVTTVGSVTTKTGYELAATGLDAIAATTPNGVASTFATKLMQLWARFFGRVTKDSDEIKTYRSDGTTVATTQTYTSSGSDDDVGAAS